MVEKKDNGNASPELLPDNAVEPLPPQDSDITPADTLQFENLVSGFSSVLIDASAEELPLLRVRVGLVFSQRLPGQGNAQILSSPIVRLLVNS